MFSKRPVIDYLAILFITTACSLNGSNLASGHHPKSAKGIVALSLTTSGLCGFTLSVDLRRVGTKRHETVGFQDTDIKSDWTRKDGDCTPGSKDYAGKLAVIALSPGTYEIYNFSGTSQHTAFSSPKKFSLKFKVTKNRVTYIGNTHFNVGKDTSDFVVLDKRERDLALFKRKYPEVPEDYIMEVLDTVRLRASQTNSR